MAEAKSPQTKVKSVSKQNTEAMVLAMATPICNGFGCEIVDVEWQKEGAGWVLRIFIDRQPGGINLDLCADVSHGISDALDVAEILENNYVLEVSSPGVERPLKKAVDFQRFAGEEAWLKLYKPIDGKKEFVGALQGYSEDGVGLICTDPKTQKQTTYNFELAQISKAHLVFKF